VADRRGEAGAMTIVALALTFALVTVAIGAGSVVGLIVAHRVAQNAADLASLAAAADAVRGADGCSTAAEVTRANHAELTTCALDGLNVTVEVRVELGFVLGSAVSARARAGPG